MRDDVEMTLDEFVEAFMRDIETWAIDGVSLAMSEKKLTYGEWMRSMAYFFSWSDK